MSVKLKVLHGAIKKQGKWQLTVPIRKSPFVIGQAADCHMRCFGNAIKDYHCEIVVDGFDVLICNLQLQSETFINGKRLSGLQRCLNTDQLQVGRLAFELMVELPARPTTADPFDELVSDMLFEFSDPKVIGFSLTGTATVRLLKLNAPRRVEIRQRMLDRGESL